MRENSSLVQFRKNPPIQPTQLASLPIIADKPHSALGRVVQVQSAEYPRVAEIIGPGPARNEYGASCVAYAQSQGFHVFGNAKTWPTHAKAAGYRVDEQVTVGSILVTIDSSAKTNTGHVTGKVEKVVDGYAYVKEQNYVSGMLTAGWVPLTRVVAAIHLR